MCAHSNKIQPDGGRLLRKTAVFEQTKSIHSFNCSKCMAFRCPFLYLDSSRICRAQKNFRP